MRQGVHDPSLLGREGRGEDQGFPVDIVSEKKHLRIELKGLGVIKIYVLIMGQLRADGGLEGCHSPGFTFRCETGDGDVAGTWDDNEDIDG